MIKRNLFIAPKSAALISISAAVFCTVTGCAVVAVADAAVTIVATGAKVTAKTIGAAADLVLPSTDKKTEKDKARDEAKK